MKMYMRKYKVTCQRYNGVMSPEIQMVVLAKKCYYAPIVL